MIDRRNFLTGTTFGLAGLSLPEWVNAGSELKRTLKVNKRYLNIPIQLGAPDRHLSIHSNGELIRELSVELAPGKPDWWVFMDLTPFKGQNITLTLDESADSPQGLNSLRQADEILGHESIYHEARRPQFHYSPMRGWMSDPNGLVYYDGEYHLFYQHYPFGSQPSATAEWRMHWGHAVSRDLVHWGELPVALYPDANGDIWSGSAVVDWDNTAGFQTGEEKALIAVYTAAHIDTLLTGKGKPFVQCLAYSNDRGRTWTKYQNNPVLPHVAGTNRDPRVFWYAREKKWVMVLYLDRVDYTKRSSDGDIENMTRMGSDVGSTYALFSSRNLKNWQKTDEFSIKGEAECPELFEIPLDRNREDTRWVAQGASGMYVIGSFDGRTFKGESQPQHLNRGNVQLVSQTFSDIPASDGRRILIPWVRCTTDTPGGERLYENMPFTQMMGIPVELTLRTTIEGLRLCANPVRELSSLRAHSVVLNPQLLRPGINPLAGLRGELLDVIAAIDPKNAATITFDLRGVPVVYDVQAQQISCAGAKASLSLYNGRLQLRLLVDRNSIEIFGNDGMLYMSAARLVPPENMSLALAADKEAAIEVLEIHTLRSIWSEKPHSLSLSEASKK